MWEYIPFENCLEKTKIKFKLPKKDYKESGKYPVVSQEESLISGYHDNISYIFKVTKPIVVFGDHTLALKYIDFDFIVGADGVKILQPVEEINTKYFYYVLKALVPKTTGYARHYKLLKKLDIPVPPLAEQERIVAKLDAAFAEIDSAINVSEIQIKNSFTIFENCVRQNFDVNIVNSEIKKLSEISTYFNGLTYSPKDVSEEGTIVLRSSNIQNGRMHFDDIVRVKKDIKEKLIVLPNDILICSRNGSKRLIGKCSLIGIQEEPMTFGTFMMVVRSEFNHYLQWFFQSNFFKEQISQGQNTTINQITRYMLDEVKLPIPDISIQNKISKQLSEIDSNVRQVNKLQTQKISELLKLKAAILSQELQPSEAA